MSVENILLLGKKIGHSGQASTEAVGGGCLASLWSSIPDMHTEGQDAAKLKLFVDSKVAIIVHNPTSWKWPQQST